MKIHEKIEKHFWILLGLALVTGLIFRDYGEPLSFMLTPLLMTILLMVFLKTDCLAILKQLKKPLFLIYILTVFLIIIPSAVYLIVKPFDPTIATGLLLLSAVPPAVASPVLTEIVKGNRSLSLAVVISAYTIAPFIMPLLLVFWTHESIAISPAPMFKVLLFIILIPLIISQTLKRTPIKKIIDKNKDYLNSINIGIITLIIFIAISVQGDYIVENPREIVANLAWVYGLFITTHILGYFIAFWRKKKDRLTLSVTKTYMNSALAIVLALEFFPPEIVLIAVLSQIPWNTMLAPFRWIMRK